MPESIAQKDNAQRLAQNEFAWMWQSQAEFLLPQLNVDSLSQIKKPKGNESVRAPIAKKLLHVAYAY